MWTAEWRKKAHLWACRNEHTTTHAGVSRCRRGNFMTQKQQKREENPLNVYSGLCVSTARALGHCSFCYARIVLSTAAPNRQRTTKSWSKLSKHQRIEKNNSWHNQAQKATAMDEAPCGCGCTREGKAKLCCWVVGRSLARSLAHTQLPPLRVSPAGPWLISARSLPVCSQLFLSTTCLKESYVLIPLILLLGGNVVFTWV